MIPLNMRFKCPECGEHNKIEINIANLKVDDVPETYTRDSKINLENFGEVPIRYKQVGDDITCDIFMKQHRLDEKLKKIYDTKDKNKQKQKTIH